MTTSCWTPRKFLVDYMAQNQKQLFNNTVYQFLLFMDYEHLEAQWHLHVLGN